MNAPSEPKIGILLVNLGTPDATDFWSVRRYLKEFLSDPRVIEAPRWLWLPILNLIVLTTRPARSGKAYASIWNRIGEGSPLRAVTQAQAKKLAAWVAAGNLGAQPITEWGMRYGKPSIAEKLDRLTAVGCDRILIFPLYPQYSATTTATVGDAVFAALEKMRVQPALRIVPAYPDDPVYIAALAQSYRDFAGTLSFVPDTLLVSFHGLPQSYADRGDPYPQQCTATFTALAAALANDVKLTKMSFQSRFGRAEWLKPYTADMVQSLAREGRKNLVVMAPGFAADCVETLEEIDIENRHFFREAGGVNYATVPCLNDSVEGMSVIYHLVARELQGWT
ncbi:ferrochelatase [Methylovirgula ligni]|uniref:Ferrochelatase n=1 Tax=Methylovirgula ligni TaxID=569860 RepID=A0A3D9Z0F5_9HYPH|nr:ferrochelatase [Methylovirgula ligni]QAY94557.1 ferrochelatase [Methylovirgula ligni]REF87578.1 ferrochelatase [Methylovirgula ligni]